MAEQIWGSKFGVWSDKDVLVHRQGAWGEKCFWEIREKSQGTDIGFEKQRWGERLELGFGGPEKGLEGQREHLGQRQGCCEAYKGLGSRNCHGGAELNF